MWGVRRPRKVVVRSFGDGGGEEVLGVEVGEGDRRARLLLRRVKRGSVAVGIVV